MIRANDTADASQTKNKCIVTFSLMSFLYQRNCQNASDTVTQSCRETSEILEINVPRCIRSSMLYNRVQTLLV